MIVPAFCRRMARYNAWQNRAIRDLTRGMTQEEADRDRGVHFRSLLGTLNHLLWADRIWLARFEGRDGPGGSIAESVTLTPTLAAWWADRFRMDGRITLWADGLSALELVGDLAWYSGAAGRRIVRDRAECIVHFFNHQTHHRGQVHAMLTAAGLTPDDTDLFLMPGDIR